MLPIGQTVYLWRRFRGFTQLSLARRSGISRPNLSVIEQGARDLTLETLKRLAEALEIPPGILADGIPPEERGPSRLGRGQLDRIARWVAAPARGGRHLELSREEMEIAAALRSFLKRKLEVAGGARPFFRRSAQKEKESLLRAKIRLSPDEFKNLLSRVDKISGSFR